MNRTVKFKDKKGFFASIDIELNEGKFSMSGKYANGYGQVDTHIEPKNPAQQKLMEIWKRWHLNDMRAGCEHQRALGWDNVRIKPEEMPGCIANRDEKGIIATWIYPPEAKQDALHTHKNGLLTKPCPVCGYEYGTKWLKETLPSDLWQQVETICNEIEAIEKAEKENQPIKTWEDIDDEKIIALAKSLDLTPAEALEDISGDDCDYEYAGISYFVGTEEEANERARDYLSDNDMWKEAVKAGQTDLGKGDWVDMVIEADGLGHILNSWDGSEDWQDVGSNSYLICRC